MDTATGGYAALPVIVMATHADTTLSGGYRLDRSYEVSVPTGDRVTVEVTVIRERTLAGSRAVAELPTWDPYGTPTVTVAALEAGNWYWATSDHPVDDVATVLGPVADVVARRAARHIMPGVTN